MSYTFVLLNSLKTLNQLKVIDESVFPSIVGLGIDKDYEPIASKDLVT